MTKVRVDFSGTRSTPASAPKAADVRIWSQEQNDIFKWFEKGQGHLIVRARAGTGKTTTILEGVNRAPEASILLAAFNKSIAQELQRKISNPRVEAKTLHGLGFAFLRRQWQGVEIDDDKRADGLARRALGPTCPDPVVRLVRNLHTKAREINPRATREDLYNLAVRFDLLPDVEWEQQGWNAEKVVLASLAAMTYAKERSPIIDFADMIFLPIVLDFIRPWYHMVVVDEAQDMTEAQLELAMRSCKPRGRICIVGDDRQAIYAFRGADSESLDRLKVRLEANELGLKTTYRCAQAIVAAAATLVPDYRGHDSTGTGIVMSLSVEKAIAEAKEGDFILSRTNAPLIRHCMDLLKRGVRARIKGRDIGKGLIALIRRTRAQDPTSLLVALHSWAQEETKRASALPEKAAEARVQFVCDSLELITALSDGVALVSEIIARAESLFADDAEVGSVMLSTVHRAKGLEANRVYLIAETFRTGKREEDNIRYVAMTRAKSTLVWIGERVPSTIAAQASQ